MRFLFQSLMGVFLMAVSIGLVSYSAYWVISAAQTKINDSPKTSQHNERVFAVKVITAKAQTESSELRAFGEVQSRRTLDIRARAAGRIVQLAENFVEGGRVQQGEFLAQIDPSDAQAQLDRVGADLADAQAATREADRTLELARDELTAARSQAELRKKALQRQQDLSGRGVGTKAAAEETEMAAAQAEQVVLSARRAVAQAEMAVDQSQTRLNRVEIARDEASRRLEETTILAEFSGTLGNVSVLQGGVVSLNERLGQLVDSEALEVVFRLPVREYTYLLDEQGQLEILPVTVMLSDAREGLTTTGRVTRDNGVVAEGQTGRTIFATLDSATGFKPGDFVSVSVQEPALENVIRLPAKALGVDGTVLVVGEDNRLVAESVQVLRRQGHFILIKASTALEGKQIVRERTPLLGVGIQVEPQDETDGNNKSG